MNEIFFYAGIVLAGCFFVLSVVLFFTQRIPAVIRYFFRMSRKKIRYSAASENRVIYKSIGKIGEEDATQLLAEPEKTELLEVAQNYATALLDADSTTLLPKIDE